MKRSKIALAALVVTVGLVASFAFTSKPVTIVSYLYDQSPSGQILTLKGTSGVSLIASELIVDANVDNVPDSWSPGSIAGHQQGPDLLGIEFNTTEIPTLKAAADAVYVHYTAPAAPSDPLQFDTDQVTELVTGNQYKVTYYKQ